MSIVTPFMIPDELEGETLQCILRLVLILVDVLALS
jgi:hypothetical protein